MQLTSLTYYADCMTYADFVALNPNIEVTFESRFSESATTLQLAITKFFVIKAVCRALVLTSRNEVPVSVTVSQDSVLGYFPAFYLVSSLKVTGLTTNVGVKTARDLDDINAKIASASITRFDKVYGDNPTTIAQKVSFCGAVS